MLQRIGVFPQTMARFAPWATGLRAVFRVPPSSPSGAPAPLFRLLSSLPDRTEAAPNEDSESKGQAEARFQNDGVKVVGGSTSPDANNGDVGVEVMSLVRQKVSVADLLRNFKPESETAPDPSLNVGKTLVDLLKKPGPESSGLDTLQTLTAIKNNAQAIEIVKDIHNSALITVLLTFVNNKTRPTPILNEIAARLTASSKTFTPKECGMLLFSLSRMYFPHGELVAKVCTDLVPAITKMKNFEVNSITKSLGHLHYRNDELLEKICGWYETNIETVKPSEILDLMCTLAYLDYRPKNKECYIQMLPKLKSMLSGTTWVDLIHSLVVLDWATPELLDSFLKEDAVLTYTKVASSRASLVESFASIMYKRDYIGIGRSNGALNIPTSHQTQETFKKVLDVLSTFGSTDNIKLNDVSPHGLPIHATFLLDKNARIISSAQRKFSNENIARIALTMWMYRDVILPDCENPIGPRRCIEELLKLEGYHVIRIPLSFGQQNRVENTIFFEKTLQTISLKLKS